MKFRYKVTVLCLLAGSAMTPVWAQTECNLPTGLGQEAVCTYCVACHSLPIITQQRLSKRVWDEVLVWMVERRSQANLALPRAAGPRG